MNIDSSEHKPVKHLHTTTNEEEWSTCFCSRQCEHQKAPYILAPINCRCLAREIANGLEGVVISVVKYSRSISARLLSYRQRWKNVRKQIPWKKNVEHAYPGILKLKTKTKNSIEAWQWLSSLNNCKECTLTYSPGQILTYELNWILNLPG